MTATALPSIGIAVAHVRGHLGYGRTAAHALVSALLAAIGSRRFKHPRSRA